MPPEIDEVPRTRTRDPRDMSWNFHHCTTGAPLTYIFRCAVTLYGDDCGAGIRQQIRRARFVQKFLLSALDYVTE